MTQRDDRAGLMAGLLRHEDPVQRDRVPRKLLSRGLLSPELMPRELLSRGLPSRDLLSWGPGGQRPGRRRLMASGLGLVLGLLVAGPVPASDIVPETSWDDLVPADWDPLKAFEDVQHLADLPDTDPQVQKLYERMREVWDNAPTVPAMEGRTVRLPGYVVPLERGKSGLREFLLVPYFGACIHTPPPPANQIVHVRLARPLQGVGTMDAVWVTGPLGRERSDSDMGASGYQLHATRVDKYVADEGGRGSAGG